MIWSTLKQSRVKIHPASVLHLVFVQVLNRPGEIGKLFVFLVATSIVRLRRHPRSYSAPENSSGEPRCSKWGSKDHTEPTIVQGHYEEIWGGIRVGFK